MDLLEKLASRMAKRVETDELSPVGVRLLKRVIDRVVQLTQPIPEPKPEPLSAKDQLAKDAGDYHDFLLHSFWEVRIPSWMNAPEPARGDPSMKDRHDEWLESVRGSTQRKPAQPVVDNLFEQFKEVWKPKDIELIVQGERRKLKKVKD